MKKIWLWVCIVLMCLMGITTCTFVLVGTSSERAFDERTYFLILSLMSMLLTWWFGNSVDVVKKELKAKKEKLLGMEQK